MSLIRKKQAVLQGKRRKQVATGSSPIVAGKTMTNARRLSSRKVLADDLAVRFATLAEVEHEHIRKVLRHFADNKTKAAKILGINRVSLWRKIRNMEITSTVPAAMPGGINIAKEAALADR